MKLINTYPKQMVIIMSNEDKLKFIVWSTLIILVFICVCMNNCFAATYRFTMGNNISIPVEDYNDMGVLLEHCNYGDTVYLLFNETNKGGGMDSAYFLMKELHNTKANTIAIIGSHTTTYSAAALIATACNTVVLQPNSSLMFHHYLYLIPDGVCHHEDDDLLKEQLDCAVYKKLLTTQQENAILNQCATVYIDNYSSENRAYQ